MIVVELLTLVLCAFGVTVCAQALRSIWLDVQRSDE